MKAKRYAYLGVVAVAIAAVPPSEADQVTAKTRGGELKADRVEYNEASGGVKASGNVRIKREGDSLNADNVTYDPALNRYQAAGKVQVRSGSRTLKADNVTFDAPKQFYSARGGATVSEESYALTADELTFDAKAFVYEALGGVHLKRGVETVDADRVLYKESVGIVDAFGGITYRDQDNSTYYAERVLLNEKADSILIEDAFTEYQDFSKLSSESLTREGDLITLENATYTPCKVCGEGPEKKAYMEQSLWNISADTVHYDVAAERISYRNATFNVKGQPVFYLPYFSHAGPNAKRKSGFLTPTYRSSGNLGQMASAPYYWNIGPDKDATIEPIFTSDEGIILAGEYRHLLKNGYYEFSGSITNPEERDLLNQKTGDRDLRGHIEGSGRFNLKNNWYAGFDGKRATDDTYLRRYQFGFEDLLVSEAFAEKLERRNYIGIRGVTFQGLTAEDDPDRTPLILPMIDAHYETERLIWNSHISLDANVLAVDRGIGVNSQRFIGQGAWHIPYILPSGHVFEFEASLRGDVYYVEDNILPSGLQKDGAVGRIVPQVRGRWSYPLINNAQNTRILIEPIVDLIVSPYGNNPGDIPNEDSQFLELSDVNLFSDNHNTGYDRIESGPRTNYGVRGNIAHEWGEMDFLVGQTYQASPDDGLSQLSGLNDNFSDYVGLIGFESGPTNIAYKYRLDNQEYDLRRSELELNLNLGRFFMGGSYIQINEELDTIDRQEVKGATSLRINDEYSIYANGRHNIEDSDWIFAAGGLVYENECVRLVTEWSRDFTRFIDIEPNTAYMVRVVLKNLGQ